MKTILVLPTYNEADNIPLIVPEIMALDIPDLNILIVDDNSPDGTGQIADELAQTYPCVMVSHRKAKDGLGKAYIPGFKLALEQGADVIGQMDSDFSHPVEKLREMYQNIQDPANDIVIGSRYIPGGALDENWPFWRKALSVGGNIYARTILNLPYSDVTGGFKLWKSHVLSNFALDAIRSSGVRFSCPYCLLVQYQIPYYSCGRAALTNSRNQKMVDCLKELHSAHA